MTKFFEITRSLYSKSSLRQLKDDAGHTIIGVALLVSPLILLIDLFLIPVTIFGKIVDKIFLEEVEQK